MEFFLNPLQDLLSSLNAVISPNESTEFIAGHVIYNPAYTFQLKITMVLTVDVVLPAMVLVL